MLEGGGLASYTLPVEGAAVYSAQLALPTWLGDMGSRRAGGWFTPRVPAILYGANKNWKLNLLCCTVTAVIGDFGKLGWLRLRPITLTTKRNISLLDCAVLS